jgi:hypothetical protein
MHNNHAAKMKSLAAVNELVDRCKRIGDPHFYFDELFFKESVENGIGLYTNKRIEQVGTAIISVPFRHCISVDAVVGYSKLNALFMDNPGYLAYPDEVLSIGLIYSFLQNEVAKKDVVIGAEVDELDEETCPWSYHVRTLPRQFNTTLFWSEEELDELKGCTVFHLTRLMKQQIQSDFESLYRPLIAAYPELFASMTIDHYLWAISIVYSRSADIIRAGKSVRCIAPILDMANHNPFLSTQPVDSLFYNPELDALQLLTSSVLEPQDECTAFYGPYPNSKLLYTYGFVVYDNPHKAIDVWTKVTPGVYRSAEKQRVLSAHPLTAVQTYDFAGTIREGYVSPALLATIRIIQADEVDMDYLDRAFVGQMISVRNEKATYVALRNLLLARMNPSAAEVRRRLNYRGVD